MDEEEELPLHSPPAVQFGNGVLVGVISMFAFAGSWDEYLKLVMVCNLSCWKLVVTSVFLFLSFLGDFYPWR